MLCARDFFESQKSLNFWELDARPCTTSSSAVKSNQSKSLGVAG